MNTQTITALMVAPGMQPCVIELYKGMDYLSAAVSIGMRERSTPSLLPLGEDMGLLHSNNLLMGDARCNRRVGDRIILGVFYIVGFQEGRLVSLSPRQLERCKARFWEPEEFSVDDLVDAYMDSLQAYL